MIRFLFSAVCLCLIAMASPAMSGTFKTITIDSDFSDWADVPVLDDDSGDATAGPDIGITKIANDGVNLYIYNSFPNGLSLGTFTALDIDSNTGTGFDVFGLGLIGAEAGWQNDFGFSQGTGSFNTGHGLAGDYFGGGHALLDSFSNSTERELAISLSALFGAGAGGGLLFADDTFDLLFWTNDGDVSATISYELATVPEPQAISLVLLSLAGFSGMRRAKLFA